MPAAGGIQLIEDFDRGELFAVQADGVAFFEIDFNVLFLVRRLLRADRELVHLLVRLVPGVFQDSALVGEVEDVAIAAVDVLFGLGDGHIVLLSIVDGVLATADFPLAPGGDDLELGVECHHGQLEAHLVVALTGAAV